MSESPVRCVWLGSLLTVALTLGACGSFDNASTRLANVVTPYKIDIVQGNFVSREQAAALKEGMSRSQVRDILGTPLLTPIFHADRWDYVFTITRQGVQAQARRVTIFFKGDALLRVEADVLPTEAEFVASLDSGRKAGKVPLLEAPEASLQATPVPPAVAAPKALPPLRDSYPPLEDPAAR